MGVKHMQGIYACLKRLRTNDRHRYLARCKCILKLEQYVFVKKAHIKKTDEMVIAL